MLCLGFALLNLGPVKTEVVQVGSEWRLLRDGKP